MYCNTVFESSIVLVYERGSYISRTVKYNSDKLIYVGPTTRFSSLVRYNPNKPTTPYNRAGLGVNIDDHLVQNNVGV